MPLNPERPAVAVVLPFHGGAEEAAQALARLEGLRTRPGDELVLADNNEAGPAVASSERVRVHACTVKRAVYAARNEAAELTSAPWILFTDADCVLPPDLLDRYFDPPPADSAGAVAGGIAGADQDGLIPRYTRSRGHLDQELGATHHFKPMAVTANVLVRRAAFERVGGFQELTRSGGDADLSWRLQAAGFELAFNRTARVEHEHRTRLRPFLQQARRVGSGGRWLAQRHPGYDPAFGTRFLARAAAGALAWPLLAQPRRGAFKGLDGLWGAAADLGMAESNVPPGPLPPAAHTVLLVDEFPLPDDPLVPACAAADELRVEALRRPERPAWPLVRGRVPLWFREDDAPFDRGRAAVGLARRGRVAPRALAPAAARLTTCPRGATLLAESALVEEAERLRAAARRPDIAVEALPADRGEAARRIDARA